MSTRERIAELLRRSRPDRVRVAPEAVRRVTRDNKGRVIVERYTREVGR